MTTEKFEFMDFLSLIPESSYETNNDSEFKLVVMTNKFGQKFVVKDAQHEHWTVWIKNYRH